MARQSSFNPLLRGAASATGGAAEVRILVLCDVFQSPTSRGGLCNPANTCRGPTAPNGFNPLLRGAASATSGGPRSGRQAPTPRFNPLLRGAASATPLGRMGSEWALADRFQSPTSRGGLCNPSGAGESPSSPEVSIPYFAGRPLQLAGAARRPGLAPGGFNPLLRGAASATLLEGTDPCLLLRGVSIPYFAGRPLQPPSPLRLAPARLRCRVSIPYFAGRPLQRGLPSVRSPDRCGVSIPYFAGRPLQRLAAGA